MAAGSERLDGDVLGEEVGDDGMPGVGSFPPDQALGVNDPNLVADDDVAMREARTRGDDVAGEVAGDEPPPVERAGDLLPPAGDDGAVDREQQAVATTADDADEAVDRPAEVEAVHVDPA
jgi:hypothetical protein